MAEAESRKRIIVLGITLFSLLLLLLSGGLPDDNVQQATSEAQCEPLNNTLLRDMCYRDAVLEVMLTKLHREQIPDDNCYHIQDPYLQYFCLRLNFRSHMMSFMSGRGSYVVLAEQERPDECTALEDYHSLFCTYTLAAALAQTDLEESKRICARIDDDMAAGECLTYIASALAMDLEPNTLQKTTAIGQVCNGIAFPSWKAECYYILADELALLRPVTHLGDIADACMKSLDAYDYYCINHVTWLLPDEVAIDFCRGVEESHKNTCFTGIGRFRALEHGPDMESTEGCEGVPSEYKESCVMGWAESTGQMFAGRVAEGAERCAGFPSEAEHSCLFILATFTGLTFAGDVPAGMGICESLPGNYTEVCLNDLAEVTGSSPYGDAEGYWDIEQRARKCDDFPESLRERCYGKLVDTLYVRSGHDPSTGTVACDRFPVRFREQCLEAVHADGPTWEKVEIRHIP